MLLRKMGGEKSAADRHGDRHVRAFSSRECLHAQPPPARARQLRGGGNTGHAACRPASPGTHPALLHPQFTWAQPLHRGLARVAFQRPPACFSCACEKAFLLLKQELPAQAGHALQAVFAMKTGFFRAADSRAVRSLNGPARWLPGKVPIACFTNRAARAGNLDCLSQQACAASCHLSDARCHMPRALCTAQPCWFKKMNALAD